MKPWQRSLSARVRLKAKTLLAIAWLVFLLSGCAPAGDVPWEVAQINEAEMRWVEIRYTLPEAGQVNLVWGVEDWKALPEALRPPGTQIVNQVMHTPLEPEGEVFSARMRAPAGRELNYGFLIRKDQRGSPVNIWDGNAGENYTSRVTDQEIVIQVEAEALARSQLAGDARPAGLDGEKPRPGDIRLVVAVPLGLALLISIIMRLIPTERRGLAIGLLLLAILAGGLAMRISAASAWNSSHPNSADRLFGDEPDYDHLAREMLAGKGFNWPGRVPLYPLWLAGIYLINGGSYDSTVYFQAVMSLATIALTYLLGRRMVSPTAGLIAAAWVSTNLVFIQQPLRLLSEVLYTPFLLLAALALMAAERKADGRLYALAGITTSLSNLVRPSLLLFPLIYGGLALLGRRDRNGLVRAGLFVGAALLTVTPWVAHNFYRYQAIFPLQTSNAILWQGSPEYYHLVREQGYTYRRVWTEVLYGPGWEEHDPNSIAGDRYWTRRALDSIAAEPLIYLKYAGEKLFTYWVGDPNADWGDTHIFNYQALRWMGFSERGALELMAARVAPLLALLMLPFYRRKWREWRPVLAMLIYLNLLHAATHAEARLSEPALPVLLVVIAGGVPAVVAWGEQAGKRWYLKRTPEMSRS